MNETSTLEDALRVISLLELRIFLKDSEWPRASVYRLSHFCLTRQIGDVTQLEDNGTLVEELAERGFPYQIHFRLSPGFLHENTFGCQELAYVWWIFGLPKPMPTEPIEQFASWEDWIAEGKVYGDFSDTLDEVVEKLVEAAGIR